MRIIVETLRSSSTPSNTLHHFTMSDLSAYEIARLQRIKENKAVIAKIGLKRLKTLPSNLAAKAAATIKKRERAKRKATLPPAVGSRRSKRIRGIVLVEEEDDDLKEEDEDEEEEVPEVDYTPGHYPQSPEYLDDYEFQIYCTLRKWRLRRKNELQIEPYKICQNRTLCELIRRRRNDINYATSKVQSSTSTEDVNKANAMSVVESDLLACWGIGPSKAKEDGFGYEMLNELSTEEVVALFTQSRAVK